MALKYHGVYEAYIERWKQGLEQGSTRIGGVHRYIKRYLREKFGNKCAKCGWAEVNPVTKKVPVTVEHIDGHWENNAEENLTLLCPNCHSLTPTYCGLNRGNAKNRRPSTKVM